MGFLLKPNLFEKMTTLSDVQKLMKQDVKNAAGVSSDVAFVAVKNVKVGTATTSLFVLTDKPVAWIEVLKAKKPATLMSGKCRVLKGAKITVAIKSVNSGSRETAAALAKLALKDPNIESVDFAEIATDKQSGVAPNAKTLDMVKKSYAQAQKDKLLDRGFELTDDVVKQMARVTNEIGEYHKFAEAFEELAKKYNFKNYNKVPVTIWAALLQGLYKSGYFKDDIPKAADQRSFILAYQGPDGKPIREKVLAAAMKGMEKFTSHAATYLDKVVAEVLKAGGTPTWSFWSGVGAKDAAKKENPGGVVLEGSVGSWFDKVWEFKPLTGVETMALWTSLSELYAQKAAEYYERFSFRGYVGQGATRDQSVFNKIEQPTFIQVLTVSKNVDAPKVVWYVVDCEKKADRWVWTGKASAAAASREAALKQVETRYGG